MRQFVKLFIFATAAITYKYLDRNTRIVDYTLVSTAATSPAGTAPRTMLSKLIGRYIWSCPDCGHVNDDRLRASTLSLRCGYERCHHIFDLAFDRLLVKPALGLHKAHRQRML